MLDRIKFSLLVRRAKKDPILFLHRAMFHTTDEIAASVLTCCQVVLLREKRS